VLLKILTVVVFIDSSNWLLIYRENVGGGDETATELCQT
jgi:hypothetical protein